MLHLNCDFQVVNYNIFVPNFNTVTLQFQIKLPNLTIPVAESHIYLNMQVCREFQRGACKRTADECRYAHPGKNIQIAPDGKVIACFDALKV